jgi:hypothetical protein
VFGIPSATTAKPLFLNDLVSRDWLRQHDTPEEEQ